MPVVCSDCYIVESIFVEFGPKLWLHPDNVVKATHLWPATVIIIAPIWYSTNSQVVNIFSILINNSNKIDKIEGINRIRARDFISQCCPYVYVCLRNRKCQKRWRNKICRDKNRGLTVRGGRNRSYFERRNCDWKMSRLELKFRIYIIRSKRRKNDRISKPCEKGFK
jgi:hypothetical protein